MNTTTPVFIRNETAKRFKDIPRWIKGSALLPRDVIVHYLADDGTDGPKYTNSIIKSLLDEHDDVYLYNIVELHRDDLHGRRLDSSKARNADKAYFTKNRNFSRVHDLDRVLSRATSPVIFNYNHIFSIFRTDRNLAIDIIYRNMGNFATVWRNAVSLETESLQLIPIRLPRLVRDYAQMHTLLRKPTKSNLLNYTSVNDIYLYSLMSIVYSDEFSEEVAEKNIVFRIFDGINHVDIPYRLIAKEMSEKGSSPELRLKTLYDILDSLVDLRVGEILEGDVSTDDKDVGDIIIDSEVRDVLDVEANIERRTKALVAQGVVSEKAVKRIAKDAAKFNEISIDGKKIKDILKESREDKRELPKSTVPDIKAPIGDSLKTNVVQMIDKEYITKTLERDLIENLATLSNRGHMVLNVTKEPIRDAASDEILYSVQTKHVNGEVATMKMTVPNVKPDGTFRSGGVNYRMGRQRMTMPVTKVSENEVAMTSSHSKMFASTGRTAADNLGTKITKFIYNHIIDGTITKYTAGVTLKPGNNMGLLEAAIAVEYTTLVYKDLKLDFKGTHTYKGEVVKFNDLGELVGKTNHGSVISILDIPMDKMGKIYSEVRIKGAYIPISMLLSYWMGMDTFFSRIGVVVTEFDIGKRLSKEELSKGPVIRFKDVKIQIKYKTMEQLLLINGLRKSEDLLREVERDSLDKVAGWKIIFALMGMGKSQERGLESVETAWIDAITSRLLIRQGYPTNMIGLFLTVNKLLSDTKFSRMTDGDLMFVRGYDRLNDIIYRELATAMNEFDANNSNKRKLTINPRAVKLAILSDGLVSPTEDTSPINQISNQTRIGYGGTGGRSDRSLVARNRVFDKNDLGVISEAGTDDGKAGTVLNTSNSPNFDSIYGTSSEKKETELGNVLSVNTLVAPFSLHDEMKRTIFSRIQSNSMIYSEGYRIMPVYTGMGMMVAQQVDGNYTHVAQQDGTILKVEDKYIEVKYKDGSKVKLSKGRGYSRNSGKILPKKLITDFKPRDTFRQGAILVWDTNYFDRSMIEPDQVELYTGAPVFMAIKDEMDTYEDGSALDKIEGDTKMASNIIHTRALSVPFNNNFKLLVKEGDTISPNTPIAIITPEGIDITEDANTLEFMAQTTPKARHGGHVVRVEVHYLGDKKACTKGLRKVLDASDKQFKEESEFSDVHPSGEIKEPTFINQEYVDKNTAVVTVYIEHLDKYGVGDKSSDCNALKTVNGYAWAGRVETLSGIRIGGKFSGDGIFRRVVTSAFSMGILNFCQYSAGQRLSDIYHGRPIMTNEERVSAHTKEES